LREIGMGYRLRATEASRRTVREASAGYDTADADDELYVLGERCAQAYMEADSLQYQAMKLLAEFHRREGWRDTGFASTAEWLAWRIGIMPGAARERVRTALALEQLPETSRAMENGELSFAKVRALSRVATPTSEGALLEFARAGSAANLERVVRSWKHLDRKTEVDAELLRYQSRAFSFFIDHDGMVVLRGRLDPEAGEIFMRAMEAAEDVLFRASGRREGGGEGNDGGYDAQTGDEADAKPEQRRADAARLMAERALAAGFAEAPSSGARADRTQVVLHVEASTLRELGNPGQSDLGGGTRVSAETSRRIACDTGVVRMAHDANGHILSVGRRTRTVPTHVRRALEARDRGCRFPGCGLRFTEGHHVKHWADGGETRLGNLVLLCDRHHRFVHEGGASVCIDKHQQILFFTPKGKPLAAAAPRFRGNAMGDGRDATGDVRDATGDVRDATGDVREAPGEAREAPGEAREAPGEAREAPGEAREAPGEAPDPPGEAPDAPGDPREAPDRGLLRLRPAGWDGSARWKRDSGVPWHVEAGAIEALEASVGWG
jgi:uncharacterized protein YjbJ (UPF0337 family)